MCLSLSFQLQSCFLKSESLLLFKLNKLMFPIGKKNTTPATTKLFLANKYIRLYSAVLYVYDKEIYIKVENFERKI